MAPATTCDEPRRDSIPDTVLITGGAGFIGSHTADALLRSGARVRVLDNLSPQIHPGGVRPAYLAEDVEFIEGDIRDYAAVAEAARGVDHLLHFAAETSVGQSMFMSDHHVDVNARGTAVVLRAAQDTAPDLATVVLSSSRAVYGEGRYECGRCGPVNPGPRDGASLARAVWHHTCPTCGDTATPVPTNEATPLSPSSVYGMTKRFQEEICEIRARQGGTRVVALRYFNVYGPRQAVNNPYTGLINTLSVRLLTGKSLVLYEDGLPLRDFVHVDDVVQANLKAITAPVDGFEAINIGSGIGVSLAGLATALGVAFDAAPVVELSRRHRVGDILASIADLSRARSVLGYEPAVDLASGLAGIREWLATQAFEDRSDGMDQEMRDRGVLRG